MTAGLVMLFLETESISQQQAIHSQESYQWNPFSQVEEINLVQCRPKLTDEAFAWH